jgi:hemerythrin-like domain-containing protein
MPTPYDGYRLIHNALLEESRGFDEAIESLDWTDHDGVTEAQGRFSAYRKVLTTHEHAEDTWFFSLVAPKFPEAVAMYSYDHRHHHNLYGEIQGLFEALAVPRGAVDAASLARQLQKRTIALRALMDSHIAKENELLVPIFEKHVDMED